MADTLITPGAGGLALSGSTPTLDQTGIHRITPAAGGIVLTGIAPGAGQTLAYNPSPDTLVITPEWMGGGTFANAGLGIFNWRGDIYSIWAAGTGMSAGLYKNGTSIATGLDASNGVYSWDSVLGATPTLFLQNGYYAYTWDGVTFTEIPKVLQTETVVASMTEGSAEITLTDPLDIDVGWVIQGSGLAEAPYVVEITGGAPGAVTAFLASAVSPITTAVAQVSFVKDNFPTPTVKGSAYLDGTLYVMTPNSYIRGSAINEITVWDALNSILAQIETDGGVAMAKQLVYVIAFGEWSTEVFYDAGNAVGSPLGQVSGALVPIGCRHQDTVREMEGSLYWVGKTRNGSVAVMSMTALKAQIISTPAVERLLEDADWTGAVYSWTAVEGGHNYYAITVKESNLTLVYDATTGFWAQWTDANGDYFPIVASTYSPSTNQALSVQPLVQHESNGKIYVLDINTYTDDGTPIVWDLYTPNYDGGTRKKKYVHSFDVIADQTEGSLLNVRVSDDDYQSWSNFRQVDLGKNRPRIVNAGTFRRRAYHLRHEMPVPLRIQALELQIDVGTL